MTLLLPQQQFCSPSTHNSQFKTRVCFLDGGLNLLLDTWGLPKLLSCKSRGRCALAPSSQLGLSCYIASGIKIRVRRFLGGSKVSPAPGMEIFKIPRRKCDGDLHPCLSIISQNHFQLSGTSEVELFSRVVSHNSLPSHDGPSKREYDIHHRALLPYLFIISQDGIHDSWTSGNRDSKYWDQYWTLTHMMSTKITLNHAIWGAAPLSRHAPADHSRRLLDPTLFKCQTWNHMCCQNWQYALKWETLSIG
ncbi:hypothetical protein K469DRAFT_271659 [Zopfia rhizophila CBS 207.26]|uniref:Uncharacterized protein n=1 Tax=Zopfia rhizophila CBS 207.26 TaxID=1314779 RepID=A0A6A6DS34_9PEZI|nr:hypothetical protein K469DRAFT_271659 [Zopfia rhizophila CBS 207.26]